MITTRAVPKKLSELGRIRIGMREPNKSGEGTHPKKLAHFRLTSANGSLLGFAAQLYGGAVEPWDDEWAPHDEYHRPTQFELYTRTDAIDVLIPTFSAISLSFERWGKAGCQQRCTGEVILDCPLQEALIGQACTCPIDDHERAELAEHGKACARILRLNVLLHDLPGIGVWRLETKGFYATAELMGTLDMLQMAGQEHQIIEAVLRLEQRSVKRVGEGKGKGTLQFAVPVLWPRFTGKQILTGAAHVLLAPGPMPEPPGLAKHIADLYGDPAVHPSGEGGAEYMARIEAVIAAQPGWNVPAWDTWATRRFRKPTEAFTTAEWQEYLDRVERAARERPKGPEEQAPSARDAPPSAPPVDTHDPVTEGEAGTQGPSWGPHGPQGPDLFAQEEREAEEYGE
jgi:Recombination directionality factor-like